MNKRALAQELRERQYATGHVERELIDTLDDDAIIDAYITCNACGAKRVDAARLTLAIAKAKDADGFLRECDRFALPHVHRGA